MDKENQNNSKKSSDNSESFMKKLKMFEEDRVKSFSVWPFTNSENCAVKNMAEAGFYYSGTTTDDDSATCFVCGKVLDGWDPTDKPWSEHKKHAPQCAFVKLGKPEAELKLEEFLDLSAVVLKNNVNSCSTKKMSKIIQKTEKMREKLTQLSFN